MKGDLIFQKLEKYQKATQTAKSKNKINGGRHRRTKHRIF
jgi:hypothetical protein